MININIPPEKENNLIKVFYVMLEKKSLSSKYIISTHDSILWLHRSYKITLELIIKILAID